MITIKGIKELKKRVEMIAAKKTADILLWDIKLNSRSSLSPFAYDNVPPVELKEYKSND